MVSFKTNIFYRLFSQCQKSSKIYTFFILFFLIRKPLLFSTFFILFKTFFLSWIYTFFDPKKNESKRGEGTPVFLTKYIDFFFSRFFFELQIFLFTVLKSRNVYFVPLYHHLPHYLLNFQNHFLQAFYK